MCFRHQLVSLTRIIIIPVAAVLLVIAISGSYLVPTKESTKLASAVLSACPELKLGQQDPVGGRFCVAELQSALRKLGYGQAVTGKFGAQTKANVQDFQRRNNIDPIGIVGPKTRRALDSALSVESAIPALPQGSYSLNESCTRYVCSLYLRRSTTSRYAQLLDEHPLATSVAEVILAGACSKVFRINLAGLVCGIVVDRYADDIQDGLRAAASQHACLRLTVRLRPAASQPLLDIGTYNGRRCAD